MPAPASATRIGLERVVIAASSEAENSHGIVPERAVEVARDKAGRSVATVLETVRRVTLRVGPVVAT
jgi:hypothetical protein